MIVIKNASYNNGVTQLLIPYNVNTIYMRHYTENPNKWLAWGTVATSEKPQLTTLSYSDPQSQNAGGGSYFTLESNGRVTLNIGVVTTMGSENTKIIAQVPTDIRPQRIIYFPTYQNIDKCGTGYINTDGNITIQGQPNTQVTAIAQISYFSR